MARWSPCSFAAFTLALGLTGCNCAVPTSTPGGTDAGRGSKTSKDGGPGSTGTCTPRTCPEARANCGPVGDGCGHTLECGSCTGSDTCGGGGQSSVCGSGSTCVPLTCSTAGANCGPVGDGCGHTIQCGTCAGGMTCGSGGVPSVCPGTSASNCTGLCHQQVACPSGMFTTVTGVVHAPTTTTFGQADPLYNAVVYVPNAPVAPFTKGVTCDQCGAALSGSPLVAATTGADGSFTLRDVPVGSNIPLVIQLGRWRRQVTIPTVAMCTNTPLPAELTRMPRNHTEGDIPLMAMVTGSADPLECVLRKIGIDDAEFTAPNAGGRVEMWVGNGANDTAANAPAETTLTDSAASLNNYDMVIFACQGSPNPQPSTTEQNNVIDYSNLGGRVFATHFSYNWLFNDAPFSSTANWSVSGGGGSGSATATVDQTFARGIAFAQWLVNVGASTTLGQVNIDQIKHDFTGVVAPSQRWLYDSSQPLHYTFNTPVGATAGGQCGRVLYSDFHVSGGNGLTPPPGCGFLSGGNFPCECDNSPMSPQEKVLEFMLFDLASCVPTGGLMKADADDASPTTCPAEQNFSPAPELLRNQPG